MRSAVIGLIGFAACEEEMLLAHVRGNLDEGEPARWAARPTVIHNSDFRAEQVKRLAALRQETDPPEFPRVTHTDPDLYTAYVARGVEAARESRATSIALIDGLADTADADLLDPSRHQWLQGRELWLQIIVRGFWHPTGHIGEYYLRHGEPERALGLHAHAITTARYLSAPDKAVGMAHYSLACAQAVAGQVEAAAASVAEAIALNSDLQEHANREPDLEPLRARGGIAH